MITYQDMLEVGDDDTKKMEFVKSAINYYKTTSIYKDGLIAYKYAQKKNATIMSYQKLLYTMSGYTVPDNFSSNWKIRSNFFPRFITQEIQYILGNGISWKNENTAEKLGKDFESKLQKLAKNALIGGCAFGFWNYDHLEEFDIREFIPIYDEENSALRAGIRFWQLEATKPLRATFYEKDGYTEYIWEDSTGRILKEKRSYIEKFITSIADGTKIYDYENYPGFPIVPLWGNSNHQSELEGLREGIDSYDLIKSGFANDLDDVSQIYWVIQNAGGMDDIDLAKFIDRMKTVKAAVVEDNEARAEAHTIDVPYASREALLDRISSDLYRDAMALDTKALMEGAGRSVQIRAAYEPLNSKADEFEYCIHDFLDEILNLAGIVDEKPTFTRSMLLNVSEEIESVMRAASNLTPEYVTKKLLTILGDGDIADDMISKMNADELDRMNLINTNEQNEETEEQVIDDTENI